MSLAEQYETTRYDGIDSLISIRKSLVLALNADFPDLAKYSIGNAIDDIDTAIERIVNEE